MKFRKVVLLTIFLMVLLTSMFPQNIYLLVLFSVLAWGLLPFRKWWDGAGLALLLFSIFYTIMVIMSGQMKSGFVTLSYLISPIALYRFGQYLMSEYRNDNDRFRLLLFVVIAYLINMFVLTFVDIAIVGIINEDRALLGTSTEDDALAATLYGLMASVGIGCIGACFARSQKLIIRLFYFVIVALSLLTVIHLINRGGLVVLIICLMCSMLINYRKSVGKLLLVVIALIIGVFLLFESGILSNDVIDAYQDRNDVSGYGIESAGGRTDLWMVSVENLFRNPMGWEQKRYAHNLWLDMARIGGWISLIPFLLVTIIIFRKLFVLFRRGGSSFSNTLVVLNLALFLAAFIEPVIEGSMLFFCFIMCVWGMTVSVMSESKINACNE